jgi:hypothetical protein
MVDSRVEARRAVLALCGEGSLVERLEQAFDHLQRLAGRADLPPELAARVSELVADLVYGGESVSDALRVVPAADRLVLASRILAVYEMSVDSAP